MAAAVPQGRKAEKGRRRSKRCAPDWAKVARTALSSQLAPCFLSTCHPYRYPAAHNPRRHPPTWCSRSLAQCPTPPAAPPAGRGLACSPPGRPQMRWAAGPAARSHQQAGRPQRPHARPPGCRTPGRARRRRCPGSCWRWARRADTSGAAHSRTCTRSCRHSANRTPAPLEHRWHSGHSLTQRAPRPAPASDAELGIRQQPKR